MSSSSAAFLCSRKLEGGLIGVGQIPTQDTHLKRSSGLSFALRWKQENLQVIAYAALITLAMITLTLLLLYGSASKKIWIVVDGEEKTVETKRWNVADLLQDESIVLGEHDSISLPLHHKMQDGEVLTIQTAIPIVIQMDGEASHAYTTGRSVAEAIGDLNLNIGLNDFVEPAMDNLITAYDKITVKRIHRVFGKNKRPVPFQTITKNDTTLAKGKKKTVQEGSEGIVVEQFENVYEDGKLVSTKLLGQLTEREAVNQIVAVGTKSPVTVLSASSPAVETINIKGLSFDAKQILKNVTLTAYSAGPASTGKSEDHPSYGITFSGAKATEGRTISVDPKVVPIGWWVYIEGFGFRRAEDIGGAVKGKKMDIYYDSEDYAKKFGTKKGYTVYVIGPKKPVAN